MVRSLKNFFNLSLPLRIFVLAFLSVAYFYPGGGHNEAARFDSIRALVVEHRAIVDTYCYNSSDLITIDGHYYPGKAPGTLIVGLPVYLLFDPVLNWFHLSPALHDHWLCHLVSVFSVGLLGALCAPLMFLLARRRGAHEWEATLIAMGLYFGTLLFPWSTVFFSHSPAAFCLFLGFYGIFSFLQDAETGKPPGRRLFWAGAALSFAVAFEYPAAIGVGLIGVWAAVRFFRQEGKWPIRSLGILAVGGLAGFVPLLIYNLWSFGKLFYIPYQALAADPNAIYTAHKQGILGVHVEIFDPHYWQMFAGNLLEITLWPCRGIFFNTPLMLVVLPGFFLLFRRKNEISPESLLALVFFLVMLAFNASYGDSIVYWGGGASFGPRHLTTMLPFMVFPAMALVRTRPGAWGFGVLALVSAFFCLMAASIEPRAPYSPSNLISDFFLPHFLNGQFSITSDGIFSAEKVTENSVAFNVGWLLGLPGRWQLMPLAVFWLLGGIWLDLALKKRYWVYVGGVWLVILMLPVLL